MRTSIWLSQAAALGLISTAATAGPPYLTDDPMPTDTRHWEIYNFAAGTAGHGAVDGVAGLDLNYGAVPGVQLTATLPIAFVHDRGTDAGLGDVEIGVKYRFFQRGAVSAAVFPRLILPTADRGFGTGRVRMLLPVWAQVDSGPWSLFGGGGYTLNPGSGNRNFWQTGLALTREMGSRLSLGAEVTHETRDAPGGRSTTSLGAGGIVKLSGPFSLLFSGGPAFEHHRAGADWNFYAAVGLNF